MSATLGNSGPSEELERVFDGTWEAFAAWIRQQIGGEFELMILSRDTPEFRQMIIDSIHTTTAANNGIFPAANNVLTRI